MPEDNRQQVVITHWVHDEVIDSLSRDFEVITNDSTDSWPEETLRRQLTHAEAMMAFMPDCVDRNLLQAAPKLRIVAGALKGPDNFDIAACTERNVWVTIVPDLLTAPTAELTVGLMLGLARNVLPGDRHVRSGMFTGWRPRLYGTGLAGSTVGLLGMGAIGAALAERLSGFGCRLMYTDHRPLTPERERALGVHRMDAGQLLTASDFVVLCVPLTAGTLHLADARFIDAMKPGAFLINPCRGSTVDEAAVAAALASGHLGGYAADVFEMEDWARADRPRHIDSGLLAASDRTLFTPHLGSAVNDVRRAIALEAAANIRQALTGHPPAGAVNDLRPATAQT